MNPKTKDARNEQLYGLQRGDPKNQRELRAKNVGMLRNFYSEDDPQSAEEHFQFYESGLRADISNAMKYHSRPASRLRSTAGAVLLNQASVMYARNPVNTNETDGDQFSAFERWSESFHVQILRGRTSGETEDRFLERTNGLPPGYLSQNPVDSDARQKMTINAMATRWDWSVLKTPAREPLLTSDTPVRIRQMPWRGLVWTWPLSATALFVAVTSSDTQLQRRQLTAREVGQINGATVSHAYLWALSATPFSDDECETIARLWENHPPLTSTFTKNVWENAIHDSGSFGFVQKRLSH